MGAHVRNTARQAFFRADEWGHDMAGATDGSVYVTGQFHDGKLFLAKWQFAIFEALQIPAVAVAPVLRQHNSLAEPLDFAQGKPPQALQRSAVLEERT
jgi:hypothetical protein